MPERVFSIGDKLSSLEIDVEDVASSLLAYRRKDGKTLPVQLHQDYLQRPPTRRFEIIGERGRIEWSLAAGTFVWFGAEGARVEEASYKDYPRNQLFIDELTHLLACVRERRPAEVGITEGAASVRIALALRESQRSGRPVDFEISRAA
jgi:predicted dehydrogenase